MKTKKLIIIVAILSVLFAVLSVSAAAYSLGDVDNDNNVTVSDARFALRAAVKLDTLTGDALKAADVDGKDGVSVEDARLILRVAVKLQEFPAAPTTPSTPVAGHVHTFENKYICEKNEKGGSTGRHYRVCTDKTCGYKEVTDCQYDIGVKVSDATCTSPAAYSKTCSFCGGKKNFAVGNALGHVFTNYVPDNNATCEKDGTKTAVCDRCVKNKSSNKAKNTVTDEGSALGHDWGGWTVIKAPTCTENGTQVRYCSRNSLHKQNATIKNTGHKFNNLSLKVFDYELKTTKCSVCGYSQGSTDNLTVFNYLVNEKMRSSLDYNKYDIGTNGELLYHYLSSFSVSKMTISDSQISGFFGYKSLIEKLWEENLTDESSQSKPIDNRYVKTALPIIGGTMDFGSKLETSDVTSVAVEELKDGIKGSTLLNFVKDTYTQQIYDSDSGNYKDGATYEYKNYKKGNVKDSLIKFVVTVKKEDFFNDKVNLLPDTKLTSLQKIFGDDYDAREFNKQLKNEYSSGEDDDIITMSGEVKSIITNGTVTYYFNAETYLPVAAIYDVTFDIKMTANIKLAFLDGSMSFSMKQNDKNVFLFDEYMKTISG